MIKVEVDWGGIKGWLKERLVCRWRGHRYISYHVWGNEGTRYCRLCGQWERVDRPYLKAG